MEKHLIDASDIDFSFKNSIHAVLGMIKLNNISLDFYRSFNNLSTKKINNTPNRVKISIYIKFKISLNK